MTYPLPRRLNPGDAAIPQVLDLIRRSFAYMEGRIDPPSSVLHLTERGLAEQCQSHEVWVTGEPVVACIVLTEKPDCLYIGKLAVDDACRKAGLARQLIDLAERRAQAKALPHLALETRVELTENHRAFTRMGFAKTAEGCHPGYDRPTYLEMRRPVPFRRPGA